MRGAVGSSGASFSRSLRASGSSPKGVDLIMYFCIFCCASDILQIMINLSPTITLYFLISMNAWNFKRANSRLEIMQKTQAHRKHLLNLISAKSCINTHNVLKPRSPITTTLGCLHKKELAKTNESLVQRIVKISKSHSESQDSSETRSLSRNLKTYSSLSRTLRLKEIEKQNEKLYSRLVLTSPTIKRDQWHKRNIETAKYKQNLHRGKYMCPDYSREACRMIGRLPRFGSTKIMNKTDSVRGKIYQISKQF